MKFKTLLCPLLFLFLTFFSTQNVFSQCFEIQSILVDACGPQESLNEMVRFKVGNAPLNSNTLTVTWPNNSWKGVIQNATSATKIAELNADIVAEGGCGQVLEPPGGIIPANASVILVTSYEMDTPLNSFGPLSETIYIIFQNNTTTVAGHFANYLAGPNGIRTLIMNFGSCTDTVSYDRALLTTPTGVPAAADGATVLFTPAGVPTYINNGCVAPVPPFTVDAGTPVTVCTGSTITLNGTAQGQQSQLWTAGTGTFSAPTALTTNYTIPANAAESTIVLTLTATNTCGLQVSDTVTLTISTPVVPNFPSSLSFCSGTPVATLPLATTSPNGITGNWNPATINNTTNGTYTFTPDAGQCATVAVLTTAVTPQTVPDFATALTVCSGTPAPILATTSPNGITGTWNPNSINTTTSGSYIFTPDTNASQCASAVTLQVTVTAPVIPDFSPTLTICSGTPAPVLETTSPNGITGTWNPETIDTTNNGTYTFTPDSGQCATTTLLTVISSPLIIPDFATTQTLCSGTVALPLPTTAPNGITGTWTPATIDATVAATYSFSPDPGQCAATTILTVSISPQTVPDFDTALTLCTGSVAPILATTSPNGITGTWFPTAISTSTNGIYTFTPDSGQCASPVTLAVNLTPQTVPDFNTTLEVCNGTSPPTLAATSPNGISGSWSPSTIDTTLSGTYLFTPDVGQCATTVSLSVTVTSGGIIPDFQTILEVCSGATPPPLASISPNGISGTWNPPTIDNVNNGTYTFTPDPGQCAINTSQTVTVRVSGIAPNFDTTLNLCSGAIAPTLATTSPNGVTGTWNPATIDTTTSGIYSFTPDPGQCATNSTLDVMITPNTVPNFDTALQFCSGATVPALATTSPNGITGTWNPTTINNTTNGTYLFTPDAGQCATTSTFQVTINPNSIPDFNTTLTICNGSPVPILATTSPNGITGTWNPSAIISSADGSYIFMPDAGQCATAVTLTVTVTPNIIPNFDTTLSLCNGSTAPVLATTAPNGVTGIWSPTTINTTASGTYTFTPDAGQCASSTTLAVTITAPTTPDFDTTLTLCSGAPAPVLASISPNGITGTWTPAAISTSTSGTYDFIPDPGQCAVNTTLTVTITPTIAPDFDPTLYLCSGTTAPALATTSPNGITGIWSPDVIDNSNNAIYTFTPLSGQCATTATLEVFISTPVPPNFDSVLSFCSGTTPPNLPIISPNNITGTWSPSVIDTSTAGSYLFTPDPGQCTTPFTLTVLINAPSIPGFDTTLTLCSGTPAPALATISPNGTTGTWTPATIDNNNSGTYTFTPDAGQCATTTTLAVTITPSLTPDFDTVVSLCSGATAPILTATSPNGITGTWNPTVISTTTDGTYTFTPDAGQCASNTTLAVTITPSLTPDFDTVVSLCSGATAPTLATSSPNGITGTWSPAVISTTTDGAYTFTPDAGQCATTTTLAVTITPSLTPDFDTVVSLCSGAMAPILTATSPNGITGTWNPTVISTTTDGTYTFTPDAGQCATTTTLAVTITPSLAPDFDTVVSLCSGATAPTLATSSPNGITGTWSPAVISTTTDGTYTFTPDAGQCATTATLAVTITPTITPNFDTTLSLCSGATAPILIATSPNGITGTWTPATIDNNNSGTYTFTPDAGQCASNTTLAVTITPSLTPDFDTTLSLCSGATAPTLATSSPNGITGTWSPAVISTTTDGTYTFTPDAGQCATGTTLTVTLNNSIIPDFDTNLTLCTGAIPPVLATTSPNGIIGTWNPFSINTAESGTYTFTPAPGQCAPLLTLTVTINNSTFAVEQGCNNDQYIVTILPENPDGDYTYTWTNTSGSPVGNNSAAFNVTDYVTGLSTPQLPMEFTVTVSNNGCSQSEIITVTQFLCVVPKGISPNGDGVNDSFDLSGLNVHKLKIFNRYGTEVYHFSGNYTNQWKGECKEGTILPSGTYYYLIETNDNQAKTGWVYLNK